MSIQTCFTLQALERLSTGTYNYATDAFKVALYNSSASLGPSTTAYTTSNELSGGGYVAGGYALTNATPVVSDGTLRLTWSDQATGALTLSDIAGCMIYNTTHSNEAVYISNFGTPLTKAGAVLTVKFLTTGVILVRST